MASTVFMLESNKFSTDSIEATLVCPKCNEVFSKEFPLDLEGQIIEFKCPVCNSAGEADLPYKSPEEKESLEFDLDLEEETSGEEFEEDYL
jgi:phage FluMu protein Com